MIKKMAIYGGIEHLNVDESFIIFEKKITALKICTILKLKLTLSFVCKGKIINFLAGIKHIPSSCRQVSDP